MSALQPSGSNYYYNPFNGQFFTKKQRDEIVETERKVTPGAVCFGVCVTGGAACIIYGAVSLATDKHNLANDIYYPLMIVVGIIAIIASLIFCCANKKN